MSRKPKIGITMRLELETNRFYLGRDYSEALAGLGAIPFHISLIPNREYISEALKELDGILLPGSDTDVNPHLYNEEPLPGLKKVIPEKDSTDIMVLEEAEKLNLPVLGICFGMQVINVWRGGSLIQDIGSQISNSLKHEQGMPLDRGSHSIEIGQGTYLSQMTGGEKNVVNSHHHQAVAKPGKDLKVSSRAKDDVIESIEDISSDKFVFGVQWHPELSWKKDKLSENIFRRFIERCSSKTLKV